MILQGLYTEGELYLYIVRETILDLKNLHFYSLGKKDKYLFFILTHSAKKKSSL